MKIRLANEHDAEAIRAIYAPVIASSPISFETEPPTAQEMARRIREIGATYPFLVTDGGYAYACQHRTRAAYRFSVDVSVYLAEHARGRGLGRALYERLFAILAAQGFCNAYAGVVIPNAASIGLHKAVGFTEVGVYHHVGFKLGKWHDVMWLERPLRPRELEPKEPIAVRDVPDLERLLKGET
jgi:L-amino acid N-acyltransferase YncA